MDAQKLNEISHNKLHSGDDEKTTFIPFST